MKPGKTFNLSKTSKRMLAQFTNAQERADWKRMMIEAEIAEATIPRTVRERADAKLSNDVADSAN
jgi:hypothetical protein